jgi:hypothetical protein
MLTSTRIRQSTSFIFSASGVKIKDETWYTHLWLAKPRILTIESGETVIQHHCASCGRDFITDISNNGLAVFVSAISFHQLNDAITTRWLSDDCPGRQLFSDEEDRRRRSAELKVVNDPRFVSMPQRPRYPRTLKPKRRSAMVTAGLRAAIKPGKSHIREL